MAAAVLQDRLQKTDIAAEVCSAGFGPGGLPALEETIEVMLEVGIDLRQHRSRHVTIGDLRDSDLIIVMTRQHAMDVVLLDTESWPRTFPIIDLVRRGQRIGTIGVNETFGQWVARVHAGRERFELLALAPSVDIVDPVGEPVAVVRRTRDVLSNLVEELVGLVAADPELR